MSGWLHPDQFHRINVLVLKLDQFGSHAGSDHAKAAERYRQGEASWTDASRIDEQHAIPFPPSRLMGMARDDGLEPGGRRIEVELGEVVDDENDGVAELQHRRLGQR